MHNVSSMLPLGYHPTRYVDGLAYYTVNGTVNGTVNSTANGTVNGTDSGTDSG